MATQPGYPPGARKITLDKAGGLSWGRVSREAVGIGEGDSSRPFILHQPLVLISSCSEEHVAKSVCSLPFPGLEPFNKSHWSHVCIVLLHKRVLGRSICLRLSLSICAPHGRLNRVGADEAEKRVLHIYR